MHLVLGVRRVGGYRQRELLGSLIPLLGSLVVHAALKILVALFCEGREW
jgi:hypothetical protein